MMKMLSWMLHWLAAQTQAYAHADQITWDGMFCRRDIGYRAVARERS